MSRLISRGLIAVLLVCITSVCGAWAADTFGSGGGLYGASQPENMGSTGYSGGIFPYPQMGDMSYPQGVFPYPMTGAEEPSGNVIGSQADVNPPVLPSLPPEGQSAFEQFVSGKTAITRAQLEVIVRDPTITFSNFVVEAPSGFVVVPVGILPDVSGVAGKGVSPPVDNVGEGKFAGQPERTAMGAGYIVGPRERIAEAFRLFGISSPYSISMDLKYFGLDLFDRGRSGFLTTTRLPVGPDYVLGPEDEVKIRIWGKVEGSWIRRIERDGTVRLPKIGVVVLGGLTFAQAQEMLNKEYSRVFTGFEMSVTLGALRTMTVYVVGNARQPGAYTVSSLATLVSALIQAGGPSKSGSMRDIQIRRGGMTVAHYDMYHLLRQGDKSSDPRLLPEDVIFIPPIGPVAAIAGSVNHPALYELKGERTVSELIELSGGLNTLAFRGRLQVERIVDNNRQIVFEFDLAGSGEKELDLRSGDIVKVFQIVQDRRTVRVQGAVQREGEYGFAPGMTLKDLIGLSGGTKYYAYLKNAELARQYISESGPKVEKINVDLEKAMAGDPQSNLPLQANDQLFVRTIPEWNAYTQVSILGEVRFPGIYTVRKGERLSSLIERAGGFTSHAYPRGAVFTRVSVAIYQQKVLDESIARLERDLVTQGAANVAVAATGQEMGAAQGEIKLVESLVQKLKSTRPQGRMVLEISSPETMRDTMSDIELENGDVLTIPKDPQNVSALGAIFNQSTFVFDERKNLEKYIEMAGGYTESADKDRIYILKVNGSAVRPSSGRFFLLGGSSNTGPDGKPLLESGDTIVVPEKIGRIALRRSIIDISQILFQATMAAGVVIAAL